MMIPASARTVFGAVLCSTVLAIGACKKSEPATTDTSTSAGAVATPPVPAPAAVSVVDIDMGRAIGADKKITDKTDDFKPTDQIYASVHTTGTAPSTALTARWTFQDGTVVDERTENIAANGDAYTEFHIAKPSGWPKGKYTVHILLNGNEVRTKDVEVK
jgi:hypothetical protein